MAGQATTPAVPLPEIFGVFQQWDKQDSGGCAVSVMRDGQLLVSGAYGQANIEAGVRNTPLTSFQLASVSKQFTAYAVHLLAAEGRLSLDDSVRKHVPGLGPFAEPITIRHLLHHTSGLRDISMLSLKNGLGGTITQQEALRTIEDQRELNFVPGRRTLYSNTNYILLAHVVERASGEPYAQFLASRVFAPLGMSNTHVETNPLTIGRDRATPYGPGSKGLERRLQASAVEGSTNIRSTGADMALWAKHLLEPDSRSEGIVKAMLAPERDASGKVISFAADKAYASGVIVAAHRGLTTVEHGGIEPGSSTYFFALPSRRTAVSILCNMELNGLHLLSRGIADAYLPKLPTPRVVSSKALKADGRLERFAGTYKEPGGMLVTIALRGGKLYTLGHQEEELVPVGDGRFSLKNSPTSFSFQSRKGQLAASEIIIHDPDQDRRAPRIEKESVPDLTSGTMHLYEGNYYSPELRTIVAVEQRGGELWLSGPGYRARVQQPPQAIRERNAFYAEGIGLIFFRAGPHEQMRELAISNGRVVALRFIRTQPLPNL